jgi:uroporphyrinogen-III decarboxylase
MIANRPLFICSSFYGLKYTNATPEEYYNSPRLYLDAQIHFQKLYPTDIIPSPVFIIGEAQQFGSTINFINATGPSLKNAAYDLNPNIKLIDPSTETKYHEYLYNTNNLLKKTFPEKSILSFIISPIDFGIIIFGILKWIDMYVFERELFFHWLKKFIDYNYRFSKQLMESGTELLVLSNIFLNNRILPEEKIKNDIVPFLEKNTPKEIKYIIHSSFMPVSESIKYLETLHYTRGYIMEIRDKTDSIIKQVDQQKILAGKVNADFMFKKFPSTISRSVVKVLEEMEGRENFILATTGSDLNIATTDEQIKAIYKGAALYEKRFR